MSEDRIRPLYEARLETYALTRDLPIAYQGKSFTPPEITSHDPEDGVYLRIYILPGATESLDIAGKHRGYVGVVQIDIVSPQGVGTKFVGELKAELAALFPNNLRLTNGDGFTVQALSPLSEAALSQGETRQTASMSFRYRADEFLA